MVERGWSARTRLATSVLLLCLCAVAKAEDAAGLLGRLTRAGEAATLDSPGVKPYYLKLDVQFFDQSGASTDKATVEQWWASDGFEKRVYTTTSKTVTEVHRDGFVFSSDLFAPDVLESILEETVHPLPPNETLARSAAISRVLIKTPPMDCISIVPRNQTEQITPAFCMDGGTDKLRVSFPYDTRMMLRPTLGKFQDRWVPIDIDVRIDRVKAATSHISVLKTQEVPLAELAVDRLPVKFATIKADGSAAKGGAMNQPNPIFPELAKRERASGTVVLRLIVGKDGHTHDLMVIASPRSDFTAAAKEAVSHWVYRPYLVDGQPEEVKTEINVRFNIQ